MTSGSMTKGGPFLRFNNLLLAEDDPAYTDQQRQVRRPRVYTIPALISDPRCYVDAAINPDGGGNPPRSAGIGICIFHPSPRFQLFIQARMHSSTSVLMAEAGGLALAARCCRFLNLQEVSFVSDNETLVNIVNDRFQSSKPWSIKPFTADFSFQDQNKRFQVLKINRVDNVSAHKSCLRSKILCFLSFASPAPTSRMYLLVCLDLFIYSFRLLGSFSPVLM